MVGMGGWGTGKSGISPNDEVSETMEDVVRGRDDFSETGVNGSSLAKDSRNCGDSCCISNSSEVGRGGRWGGGRRPGGCNRSGLESSASSVLFVNGHCGVGETGGATFLLLLGVRFWFGLCGKPIILDLSGNCPCTFAACSAFRAARTEPFF